MRTIRSFIDKLSKSGQFTFRADGNSMFLLLKSGDTLYYRCILFKKCKINDLILVQKNKNLFPIVTKGDNNLTSEGKIYPKQIIGRVFQIKRNGKIFNPENIYLIQ